MSKIRDECYEEYLLSNNRNQFVANQMEGSDQQIFFRLLLSLNEEQTTEVINRQLALIESLAKNNSNIGKYKGIKVIVALNQLAMEKDSVKIKQLLAEFNSKYLNVAFEIVEHPQMIDNDNMVQLGQNKEFEHSSRLSNEQISSLSGISHEQYTLQNIQSNFNQKGIESLDPDVVLQGKNDPSTKQFTTIYYLKEKKELYKIKGLPKYAADLYKAHYKDNRLNQFLNDMSIDKWSLPQLNGLSKLMPILENDQIFVVEYILPRMFPNVKELEHLDDNKINQQKKQMKCTYLKDIIQFLSAKKTQVFNQIICNMQEQLLEVTLDLECYDFDLFFEVLQFKIKKQQEIYKKGNSKLDYPTSQNKVLKKYIKEYIKKHKTTKKLLDFYDSERLKKIEMRMKLLNGETVQNVEKMFSEQKLKQLQDRKKLIIQKDKKTEWKLDEKVSLAVRVKNVKRVEVKVFQLNSEQYYLKKKQPIDGQINLDGLVANYSKSFEFAHQPIHQHIHNFELDAKCLQKPGVFLVEFIGNGLSSRTVFQKGQLSLLQVIGLTGHKVKLYDQNRQLCVPKENSRLGIYLNGEFIASDSEGNIRIPFQSKSSVESVIAVQDNLAQLCELQLKKEEYWFQSNFIYNNESLIDNNVANIVLQPYLFLSQGSHKQDGIPVSFKLINNFKINVDQKNEQDIVTNKIIEISNEKLIQYQKNSSDIDFQIQIIKNVKSIKFSVSLDVKPMTQPIQKLTEQQTIKINNQTHEIYKNVFCGQYLKRTKEGAKIYLLGKSGEPKANVNLNVLLVSKYHKDPRPQSDGVVLKTDETGAVDLGPLNNIQHIYSVVKQDYGSEIKADSRKWTLVNNEKKIDYQSSITILENETIKFPFLDKSLDMVCLYKKQVECFLEDRINSCKVQDTNLVLSGLEKGNYILIIDEQRVQIEVIEGNYLEDRTVVIHEDKLTRLPRNNFAVENLCFVKDVTVAENKGIVQIETNRPGVNMHLMAFNFYDKEIDRQLQTLTKQTCNSTEYEMSTFDTQIYNSKQLSDEYVYVLDRKDKPRYIGNYLQKPSVILNKKLNQETKNDLEILNEERDYLDRNHCQQRMMKKCAENLFGCSMANRIGNIFGAIPGDGELEGNIKFIRNTSQMITNIKSNDLCQANVQLEIEKYQSLLVIVHDQNQVQVQWVGLSEKAIERKDLGQQQNEGGCFISSRCTAALAKGKSLTFNDMQNTEFQLLDSLAQLSQVQNLLQPQNDDHEWAFLLQWDSINLTEKHNHYNKKACHELNLFLFFKDPTYFDLYVQPFLANKLQKTFIDHFLLKSAKVLETYLTNPALFQKLAQHEVLLLLHFLVNSKDSQLKAHVSPLLNYIKARVKPTDKTHFNKTFDRVMNSKANDLVLKKEVVQQRVAYQNQKIRGFGGGAGGLFGAAPVQMLAQVQSQQINRQSMDMDVEGSNQMMMMEEEQCQQVYKASYESISEAEMNEQTQLYQSGRKETESTKEYIEREYHFSDGQWYTGCLFTEWHVSYANHLVSHQGQSFIDPQVVMHNSNMGQKILAISLTDLPFQSLTPDLTNTAERGLILSSKVNTLVFYKQFQLGKTQLKPDILVSQRFYDVLNQYREEDGLRVEREVEEYVINRVYGCQVAVTNCSVAEQPLQVIFQIPHRSLPVASLEYTHQVNRVFPSFTTQTFSFFFYFSSHGLFSIQPASVNRASETIAIASQTHFNVLNAYTQIDTQTLSHVLSTGTPQAILAFLTDTNLHDITKFDPSSISHLFHQQSFYQQVAQIYQEKHFIDPVFQTYSMKHADKPAFFNFFANKHIQDQFKDSLVYYSNDFIKIDQFQMKEYFPIINSRVHQINSAKNGKNILNVQFRKQYFEFIKYLCYKQTMSNQDKIVLIYYLLLQERIEEAINIYKQINKNEEMECQIQYDYLESYLDFYINAPNFPQARALSAKYLDYPIISWRQKFQDVANLLAEYDGEIIEQEQLADTELKRSEEEQISIKVEAEQIQVSHTNVDKLSLFIYKIDLEVLFSINPFILTDNHEQENFMLLLPNLQFQLQVSSEGLSTIPIPEQFKSDNLQLMVQGSSKTASATYFPNQIQVVIQNSLGELRVLHKSKKNPLQQVYIKTFVKLIDGSVMFFKDGYTDIVGRFNYSQSTSAQVDHTRITEYSILIASDKEGCVLRSATKTNSNASFKHVSLNDKDKKNFNDRVQMQQVNYDKKASYMYEEEEEEEEEEE